jgi:quercetin dioxygenase-like cupin family protein
MLKIRIFLPVLTLSFLSTLALAQTISPPNNYQRVVKREVLASGYPLAVEGRILELVRYTIPPLTKLPTHFHPGMQIVQVESGTLNYTVVKGTATITRANGQEEKLRDGQSTILRQGDALVEPEGMIHYGENNSEQPVILLSASLFVAKEPKAILVTP